MMGSGKSSVGHALAADLGVPFVDLDRRVERVFGLTVAAAFERSEAHFRALEREALRSLCAEPALSARGVVVATGGGTVVDPDNRDLIDATGTRVLLRISPAELAARLRGLDATDRPLVASVDDLQGRLTQIWDARRGAYEDGARVVDGEGSVSEVVHRVREALDLRP